MFIIYITVLYDKLTNTNNQEWKMPIMNIAFVDISTSPNYELAYAFVAISIVVVSLIFSAIDFTVVAILIDLILQFKILFQKIRETFGELQQSKTEVISNKSKNSYLSYVFQNTPNWKDLQKSLKYIVKYHLYLIQLVDETDRISAKIILCNVLGNLILICFAVYNISVVCLSRSWSFQNYLWLNFGFSELCLILKSFSLM